MLINILFVTLLISISYVFSIEQNAINDGKTNSIEKIDFPEDFQFGVATAAYQIEGGWNADGKGLNVWDTFTHDFPEKIADRSNGDVGPDSYHFFKKDLEALKYLKVNFYRFSISWARVLPTGDISSRNQAGIDYYNQIINDLLENGIEPMVTMIHYDLPAELQKFGGYTNCEFVKYFREYANLLFKEFGDRVKKWITFNEPEDICILGYGEDEYPPLANASGIGDYLCAHNTIRAHAAAYHLYREKYFNSYGGKIGITLSSRFYFSRENNQDVIDRGLQYILGLFSHPIFSKVGGYPKVIIDDVAQNSKEEGRPWSRLPSFGDEKDFIRGSADFLGLNYYTSRYAEIGHNPGDRSPSIKKDSKIKDSVDPSWKRGKSAWLYSVPKGLRNLLNWIKKEYDNVEVIITENGWSDDGQLEDDDRIEYIESHLKEVSYAITQDGCNVKGYAAWSLIDNFEWLLGYTEKFGLYSVNFNSPAKERIPKKSAHFYRDVITSRGLGN